MKNYLFVLIDKENTVIWAYRITAENKAAALNAFAEFVINNRDLQFDINNTVQINIMEG